MNADQQAASAAKDGVPVCAVGASAGGVRALTELFKQLPADLGLAYVVIVHLSPEHPSALAEILATCTTIPVDQVTDGPKLTANCVYVISPDRELVIEGNKVTARESTVPRGHRAPVDMFFRSVAAARSSGVERHQHAALGWDVDVREHGPPLLIGAGEPRSRRPCSRLSNRGRKR